MDSKTLHEKMTANTEAKSGVYSIVNPKGATYVGSTVNLKRRFQQYKYLRDCEQWKLKNSIKKYGLDAHQFTVLEYVEESGLHHAEVRHGSRLRVLDRENLNLRLPVDGSLYCGASKELRRKFSRIHKGKRLSPEHRLAFCLSQKGKRQSAEHVAKRKRFGEDNPMYGKTGSKAPFYGRHHSTENRLSMSMTRKNKGLMGDNPNAKPLLDLQSNAVFPCMKAAASALKMNYSTLKSMLQGVNPNKTSLVFLSPRQ